MADEVDDFRTSVALELLREECRASVRPGFYKMKLARGGPWVAVKLEKAGEGWRAVVDGVASDWHPDAPLAKHVLQTRLHGVPITESIYRYLLAYAEWCRANDPTAPEANPAERYDAATGP